MTKARGGAGGKVNKEAKGVQHSPTSDSKQKQKHQGNEGKKNKNGLFNVPEQM